MMLLQMMTEWRDGLDHLHNALHGDNTSLSTKYLGKRLCEVKEEFDKLRMMVYEFNDRISGLEVVTKVSTISDIQRQIQHQTNQITLLTSRIDTASQKLAPILKEFKRHEREKARKKGVDTHPQKK